MYVSWASKIYWPETPKELGKNLAEKEASEHAGVFKGPLLTTLTRSRAASGAGDALGKPRKKRRVSMFSNTALSLGQKDTLVRTGEVMHTGYPASVCIKRCKISG